MTKSIINKSDKRFKMTFKKGLLIYTVVAVLLILLGLSFFWRFIGNYEESMPVHSMEKIIKEIKNGNIDKLFNHIGDYTLNEFQRAEDGQENIIIAKYKEYIGEKELTFQKSKEYTAKAPVYVLLAGDKKIAEIKLSSQKRNASNFKIWEFDSIYISNYLKNVVELTDIKIQVPEGTVVTVNGKEVPESYKTEATEVEELKDVAEYMAEVPKMSNYEIKGFCGEPEVKAVLNGEELKISNTKNTYTGTFTASEEFADEMAEYVDKVAVAYAKNFINVQKKILPYVMKDSELYSSIKSATTAWYPNSKIESYEFSDKSVTNFQVYSDDCFSCDVKYTLNIKFIKSYNVEDPTEIGDFKWFFVKKDDVWYLTSMIYNYE